MSFEETAVRMDAERELRNLENIRAGIMAHILHLQAFQILPRVVRITYYDEAERQNLKKKASWTSFPELAL